MTAKAAARSPPEGTRRSSGANANQMTTASGP
jgi:hypothetical protein